MRNSKLLAWFISIVTFVLGVVATMMLKDTGDSTGVVPWAENIILITSFVVSFVAFIFSMITYYSIDKVSNITSMDGNVLENEDYAIAYEEMIDDYAKFKDEEAFTKALFDKVKLRKGKKTCIGFADYLQNILNHIIWFAYVDFNNEKVNKDSLKLVKKIQDEAGHYERLSNGINYQLKENVKLIEYILVYQRTRSQNCSEFSKLENVRGNMLRNPISRILYYDYLGLDYRRKAAEIMGHCGDSNAEFSEKHMRAVLDCKYEEEDRKHFQCFIERTEMCFNNAYELAKDNVLWEGYISYNKVRVDIMKYLMYQDVPAEDIMKALDEVVRIRENAAFLFKREESFLSQMFEREEKKAKDLRQSFEKLMCPDEREEE